MVKVFKLEELDCANCAAKIENEISQLENVNYVSVNFFTQKLILDVEEEFLDAILKSASKICKKHEKHCRIIVD